MNIIIMTSFLTGIPNDLIEAARIDGAGEFRTYKDVILPLSRTVIVTVSIFTFIGNWNSYLWPYLCAMSEDLFTLPIGIPTFVSQFSVDKTIPMTVNMIASLPILLFFIIFEKQIVKGISLSGEPVDTTACFDRKWTGEALGNLLDNAIKYTPAGGSVSVSVVPYELFCRIDVADTGIGLTEDECARVFERFYRAPAAHDAPGVGLGLYLAREIAAANGGYIKVSARPGAGSTFSLFLPRPTATPDEM